RDDLAAAFGAWPVHLPAPVLRTAAALAWRARIQPVDPGWLDLAFAVPLMDSARARRELGWEPSVDARAALAEVVAGMAEAAGTASPVLRPRSVVEQLAQLARRGPIGDRRLP
ncbi:MAG: epimerase, partial [Actinomycetota bacterium]|nr:epimerase [Actinomycetota bacterium]